MEQSSRIPGSTAPASDGPGGLALAFTLTARLCHDMAGTLGALAGTLELAAEGQDPEALELALACARELSARLRLLRAAWSADPEPAELPRLVAGLPGAERLTVDLSAMAPGLAEAPGRLAVNLLLLAAQALPRGGSIRMQGGDGAISIEIAGPRAAWPDTLGKCLSDESALQAACASTREVGLAVTCLLARQLGMTITLHSPLRLTAG